MTYLWLRKAIIYLTLLEFPLSIKKPRLSEVEMRGYIAKSAVASLATDNYLVALAI